MINEEYLLGYVWVESEERNKRKHNITNTLE